MISAVRNGPMRTVETKMNTMLTVVATLIATRAAQPTLVCGGFQVRAPSDTATKISAWATTDYQVVSRASSPTRKARVMRSTPVRQHAAPSPKAIPETARPAG
jgi:hypothetical protein